MAEGKRGIEPDAYTYNSIISMYGNKYNFEKVEEYRNLLIKKGFQNIQTENNMLNILSR